MVVDTSAIVAIARAEDEAGPFADLILRAPRSVVSVASMLECFMVLHGQTPDEPFGELDELLAELAIEPREVDLAQARFAREAFRRFGRGRHPAGLNFGDCFAYALARARDEPLLFKGEDFARTDITPAYLPPARRP